jgi:hypothetical protein
VSILFQERSLRRATVAACDSLTALKRSSNWTGAPLLREGSDDGESMFAWNRQQIARRVVLRCFVDPLPDLYMPLHSLSKREWKRLLRWLDVSGLALYFLDRLVQVKLTHILPDFILARLRQSMEDNAERTGSMLLESAVIQREFETFAISYAVLKGVSFFPESVPRLELRHQFDLDFLVAAESIFEAQRVLERLGYRLYAVSGRSWEFKKDEKIGVSMEEFYKDTSGKTVELHIEAPAAAGTGMLSRVVRRPLYGIDMPVLSPFDLFFSQAMHAYKHICGEFSRTGHLLECYRHVLARRSEDSFWIELRFRGMKDPKTTLGLGVVILLLTTGLGEFAPTLLTEWTVDQLSPAVRLWVKLHGPRALFADVPGSKLYLLLRRETEPSDGAIRHSLLNALLPRGLPPPVVHAASGETASTRIKRYRLQMNYALFRLRFHLVEGFRYGVEAYRWRKFRNGCFQ